MTLGIGKEAAIFLYAVLSGIVTFSSYQILCLFRKLIKHHIAAVSIEDFLYWIVVSAYLFRQMYHTTYGNVRWFFILDVVFGNFLAYFVGILMKKIIINCKKILEKTHKSR